MSIDVKIIGIQDDGTDSLTGKTGVEVLIVTFADGTLTQQPVSQKSLMQLLRMKLKQNGQAKPVLAIPINPTEAESA
jgi:hypothetical protein